jgi:N-acetylglutamate synthase-like GNAT family acetyltransferase
MASQDLNYPHYDDWLQRTETQIEKGEKRATIALSEGKLVANLITQTCKDSGLGSLIEIKNGRVHPELRDRYFMKFMLRQLYKECEGRYDGVITDIRANQNNTLNYLIQDGFMAIAGTTLYENVMEEVTLFRPLKREARDLVPIVKKVILAKSI